MIRTSTPLPNRKSYFLCLSSVSHHRPACLLRWRPHFFLLFSPLSPSLHFLLHHGIKSLAFICSSHQIKFSVTPPRLFSHKYIICIQSFEDHQQWLQSTPTSLLPLFPIPATPVWLLSAAAMLSGTICAQIGSMFTPHPCYEMINTREY